MFQKSGIGYETGQEQVWGMGPITALIAKTLTTDCRVLFVNPSHPQATDQGNVGQNPIVPFATIQAALAQCRDNAGDIVLVGGNDAWQYGGGSTWQTAVVENVTVATEGVRIYGVSASPLGVYWQPATIGGTCLTIQALDVEVAGFAFVGTAGGGNGIYAEWDGVTLFADNVHIHDCCFDDGIDIAIQLEYSWFCHIYNCVFAECDTYGIYADAAGSGTAFNHIHHNRFSNIGTTALALLGGSDNNEVAWNSVFNDNAQGGAAATDEGFVTTGGSENFVHHNTFSCLLPVPAAGDYNDLNSGTANDAWVHNYCIDGVTVTNNPT